MNTNTFANALAATGAITLTNPLLSIVSGASNWVFGTNNLNTPALLTVPATVALLSGEQKEPSISLDGKMFLIRFAGTAFGGASSSAKLKINLLVFNNPNGDGSYYLFSSGRFTGSNVVAGNPTEVAIGATATNWAFETRCIWDSSSQYISASTSGFIGTPKAKDRCTTYSGITGSTSLSGAPDDFSVAPLQFAVSAAIGNGAAGAVDAKVTLTQFEADLL